MTHPNYDQWSADMQAHYDKTAQKINKFGHTILGTVDGKGNLKSPFAYSLGPPPSGDISLYTFRSSIG